MELREAIRRRKSVRNFEDTEPPDLTEIMELAAKGPSAGAIRGYEAILSRERIGPYGAPVYIVICVNPDAYVKRYGDRGRNLYAIQDATIYGAYLQLLLEEVGLSSCWVGAFNEWQVQQMLGTELRPIAMIAVGFRREL